MKRAALLVVAVLGLVSGVRAEIEAPDEAELVRLRAENKVLRATIRRLGNELDTLRAKVKEFIKTSVLVSPAKVSASPDSTIQELLTRQDEELADAIKALQMHVNLGRAKVSKLIRAKVDVDMRADGRDYTEVKKGDFRTEHDRSMAVQAAREELLPLAVELISLKEQQARLRGELAKAVAASAARAWSERHGAVPREDAPPPQADFPSLTALFATVPAKFMPTRSATDAQTAALKKWAKKNLPGKTLVVGMRIDRIWPGHLSGETTESVVVHGRKAYCRIYASFADAEEESLLPLTKGMKVRVTGTLCPAGWYSSDGTDGPVAERPVVVNKRLGKGWTASEAGFYVSLEDCRLAR